MPRPTFCVLESTYFAKSDSPNIYSGSQICQKNLLRWWTWHYSIFYKHSSNPKLTTIYWWSIHICENLLQQTHKKIHERYHCHQNSSSRKTDERRTIKSKTQTLLLLGKNAVSYGGQNSPPKQCNNVPRGVKNKDNIFIERVSEANEWVKILSLFWTPSGTLTLFHRLGGVCNTRENINIFTAHYIARKNIDIFTGHVTGRKNKGKYFYATSLNSTP